VTGFQFTILALAAYRTWAILAEDDLTEPLRRRLSPAWAAFVVCPWCLGFWVAVAWAAAFWVDERAVWAAVPFALSAVVGLVYEALERLQAYEDNLPG
jgi:hypothetical protein